MELFKGNKGNIRMFCIGFSLASLLGLGLVLGFNREARVENVYIDMDRIITKITRSIAEQELTGQKLESAIESYRNALDKELAEYTSKHKVIIFSSPKPISGADNKTDYFLEKLKRIGNNAINIEQKLDEVDALKAVNEEKENVQEVTNQSSITSESRVLDIMQSDTLTEGEKPEQKLAKEDEKPVKLASIVDNISPNVIDLLKRSGPAQLTELSKEE